MAAGVVILLDVEINLVMVGAFLTIAGYSINDTIVVFDRIRENLRTKRGDIKDVMNLAINTTLSRTVLTSVTTLLTLLALFLAGGAALRDFSLSVIIGILIGTYSSIFVASPIVYWWSQMRGNDLRHEVLEAEADKLLAEESI
ncbi:MAG: SecD/SecF fusion protein [Verrucomicrobiales bacterium]